MQCRQCHFENMPGLERCFKCGSVLSAAGPVDTNVVRMARWKSPLRAIGRAARRGGIATGSIPAIKMPYWVRYFGDDSFLSVCVSVVPGLGHACYGKFIKAVPWIAAWIISLGAGIALFGSDMGLFCIGLALAIHGYIAVSCCALTQESEFGRKVMWTAAAMAGFATIYYFGGRYATRDYWLGRTAMSYPAYRVETEDVLLVRLEDGKKYKRGTLGAVRVYQLVNYERRQRGWENGMTVAGQIVGIGGDTVKIEGDSYIVNGQKLEKHKYPVPRWLSGRKLEIGVPEGSYFFSTEYRIGGRGGYNEHAMVAASCVVRQEQIRGPVLMRWLPVGKRGFLPETP